MAKQTQAKSEKAGSFTFGIEIECLVPNSARLPIGTYSNPREIRNGFPEGWQIKTDSTVSTTMRNYRGIEIVSPILKGIDGLDQLKQVTDKLDEMGARVNRTCGFHVHVGAKSAAGELADDVARWVSNLIHLVGQHELALYASTGSRYRATTCRFTRSIKQQYPERKLKELKKKKWDVLAREITGIDRYRTLNVNNMLNGRMTVEFRVFAGTISFTKMLGHIQMAMGLCEKALGPVVPFKTPQTRIYKGGDGSKALNRLLFLLGWNLGRKDVGKPECSALGWISNLTEIKTVKSELRRLAKKFDSTTD